MRFTEAKRFINAFNNPNARNLVKAMLKKNYAAAILSYHPNPSTLSPKTIERKCKDMIDVVFSRIEDIKTDPEKLFPLFAKLSRNSPNRDAIWFDAFMEAYQNYKHHRKLKNRYEQLKPFFQGQTYCDVGCGGGDFLAYFKNNHPQVTSASGIDVMDWRSEEVKEQIDFQMLDFSKPGTKSAKKFDMLTCLAVIHHVGNTEEAIGLFLQNLRSALHENSRLIIEEDVIISSNMQKLLAKKINPLKAERKHYRDYLQLDESDQKDVLTLIDFLANCLAVGVPSMPFPCGFQTIEKWIELFQKNQYKVEQVIINGFISGNFNQSSHVVFLLGLG